MRPTIRDVAKKAGVGVGTVSRVLNNSAQVTESTRERVMEAIQELRYRPNFVARYLPRKIQLHNIGVITQPFVSYQAFAERLRGVQIALSQAETEYELVLYSVSSLDHYDHQLQSIVRSHTVEGLVIIDFDLSPEQENMLNESGIPYVGLNHLRDRDWACIGSDNVEGGYTATRYLIELGHRKIAYVGDVFKPLFDFATSGERYQGYVNALEESGLTVNLDYVRLGVHGYDTAKSLTEDLLQVEEPPTAIFAMSDIQALGCIHAVREAGLRVPEDISVIGYDDLELAFHVGLTTIHQHLELTGKVGIAYLLRQLSDDNPGHPPAIPPVEVIPRQSTQPSFERT